MLVFLVLGLCGCRSHHRRRNNADESHVSSRKSQVGPLAAFFKRIGVKAEEDEDLNSSPPVGRRMKHKLQKMMEKYAETNIRKAMKKRRRDNLRSLIDLSLYHKYGFDGVMMTRGLEGRAKALLPYLILRSNSTKSGKANMDNLLADLLETKL